MRRSVRSLFVLASSTVIVIGGVALAGPAAAGSWSGSLSCPSTTFVKAKGLKGGEGPITVSAAGRSVTDSSHDTGYYLSILGTHYSGTWSVTGLGASSGTGFCGT